MAFGQTVEIPISDLWRCHRLRCKRPSANLLACQRPTKATHHFWPMPYLTFLFNCLIWGSSFILMDRAAQALGPLAIGTIRLLGGSLTLALWWAWTRPPVNIDRSDWKHIAIVAAMSNAWPFTVLPFVMAQADEHGYFGMMVSLVPLVTILASIPMLGIWPSLRQVVGVIGGLVCLGGVVLDGSQRGIAPGILALAVTVPTAYAVGNTYIKARLNHLEPLPLTVLLLGIAGLLLLPLQMFPDLIAEAGLVGPDESRGWALAIVSMILLAVLSTGLATLMFLRMVKYQGPLFAGMVTYVIPLVALAWGQYDSERLTTLQVTAIMGVLAMVALVQWRAAGTNQPQTEPLA
jgi:drug/metabolite transporter (DMT)-like permease